MNPKLNIEKYLRVVFVVILVLLSIIYLPFISIRALDILNIPYETPELQRPMYFFIFLVINGVFMLFSSAMRDSDNIRRSLQQIPDLVLLMTNKHKHPSEIDKSTVEHYRSERFREYFIDIGVWMLIISILFISDWYLLVASYSQSINFSYLSFFYIISGLLVGNIDMVVSLDSFDGDIDNELHEDALRSVSNYCEILLLVVAASTRAVGAIEYSPYGVLERLIGVLAFVAVTIIIIMLYRFTADLLIPE